jgi:uncharacterized protein (DUF1778 family)
MTDNSDPELDALRRQTSQGDRLDEAAQADDRRSLRDDIVDELAAIDAGERQKTVSVWDGDLAAFVAALDQEANAEHRAAVGHALREALGRADDDDSDVDRSEVLRLALRLGFAEAAPEYLDTLREAIGDHAADRL